MAKRKGKKPSSTQKTPVESPVSQFDSVDPDSGPEPMGMGEPYVPPPVFSDTYYGTVNPNVKVDDKAFLSDMISMEYTPGWSGGMYGFLGLMNRNRPPFSYWMIKDMICDPRILLGLWLLKGPIVANPEFEVECSNSQVTEFVTKQVNRFYRNSAHRVMKCLEWGYSASEVLYRYNSEDGLIHFDTVRDLDPLDCRPVENQGKIVGFRYRKNLGIGSKNGLVDERDLKHEDREKSWSDGGWRYIGAPRALWHVHWRERNPWFGVSRLFGVHVPWWEKWSEDGFRNIRRLWFGRCAFDGGIMYHPSGTIPTRNGPLPARDYARELIEKKRTGAVLTLPNNMAGTDGSVRAWEYQAPEGTPTPAGLIEYGESLDLEVLEAFGIPPGIVQAISMAGGEGGGADEVSRDAYYAILHEINLNMINDFDTQNLRYLVQYQFGVVEYEIVVKPIGTGNKDLQALAPLMQPEQDPNADPNQQPEVDPKESSTQE